MNFLTLAQKVCLEVELTSPTSVANATGNTARVLEFINQAYQEIWLSLFPKNEGSETEVTATSTAGQRYINIPSTLSQVSFVAAGNNPQNLIIPWHEFELNYNRSDLVVNATGYPDVAAIYARKIYLYPAPDLGYTLTLRGRAAFTELTADADIPALHEDLHRGIKILAVALYEEYHNNPTAQIKRANAENWMQMTKRHQRGHGERLMRIMSEDEYAAARYPYRVGV